MQVTERFLNYVGFDTQSCEENEACPSTPGQRVLAEALAEELRAIGVADARVDEHGYVYGSVPGTLEGPTIGLIAHMDTSPDCSGKDIHPRILEYQGGDIVLNEARKVVMREKDFPILKRCVGKHLIVTDGTTLLGADDKAGVAEIVTAVEELIADGTPHYPLRIAFTPDEEVGRGADLFDVPGFGADFAYTLDGSTVGGLEYECFNAAAAVVTIHGVSIHPGIAKNRLINAMQVAIEFHTMLPVRERPENTEGYEGFSMLSKIEGNVEWAELHYIIRDHDMWKFEDKKARFGKIAAYLNERWGEGTVDVRIKDTYYNMKEKLLPVMHVVERAEAAIRSLGIEPVSVPIRGGTDGARLSYEGLPCPNLCTGAENCHGRYEFVPVEDMELCVQMIRKLVTL